MYKKLILLVLLTVLTFGCAARPAATPPPQPTQEPVIIVVQATPDYSKIVAEVLKQLEEVPEADPDVQPLMGAPSADTQLGGFLTFVASDVNAMWKNTYAQSGLPYDDATFRIWDSTEPIPTGGNSTWSPDKGPVYIPSQETVYIPLTRLAARSIEIGDFALAVIVAHEYGHHAQNEIKIWDYYVKITQDYPTAVWKNASIRVELQADCLAGVWARTTYNRQILDEGDIEEAVQIMSEIGDDVHGRPVGEWDHGPAQSRIDWFNQGYTTGQGAQCDTWSDFNPDAQQMTIPSPGNVVITPDTQDPQPEPETTQAPQQQGNLITDFFVHASDPECKAADDDFDQTSQTIRCTYPDIVVDYDEWFAEQAILNYANENRDSGNLIYDKDWSANQSGQRGQRMAWETSDGTTIFFWTVDANRVTGTAYKNGAGADVLESMLDWFTQVGSIHYTDKAPNPSPQPQVTSAPQQGNLITDFFTHANDPECEVFEDSFTYTLYTLGCTYQDYYVYYEEWENEKAILDFLVTLRERDLIYDEPWAATQGNTRGEAVAWVSDKGNTVLLWSVNAHRLVGTVFATGSGEDVLNKMVDFFHSYAAVHKVEE